MTRHSLATLVLSSLLALPVMAQDTAAPAKPAEAPVAVVPTVEPKMAPSNPAPHAQAPRALTETETKLHALLMRNQELTTELTKRRVEILKTHPEIGEKIAAGRTESEELRRKAAELRKQASELDKQAVQANMANTERVYGEIDPDFAAKSKEQADLLVELQKLRNQVVAERQQERQQKTAAPRPNTPVRPHLQKHPKPEVKPAAAPEETKPAAQPAE